MRIRQVVLVEANGSRSIRTLRVKHWADDVVLRVDLHPSTTGAIGSKNYKRVYARTGWCGWTGFPLYVRRTA